MVVKQCILSAKQTNAAGYYHHYGLFQPRYLGSHQKCLVAATAV
jgi:hypothetical protein